MQKVLLIDKSIDTCKMLSSFLKRKGYQVRIAYTGLKGLKFLKEEEDIHIVLTDIRLSDFPGVEIIKEIKNIRSNTQVLVVSSYSDVKIAVKAIKTGAFDYVTKPILPEEILLALKEANKRFEKLIENSRNKKTKKKETVAKYVKGNGTLAKKINNLLQLVGPTNMSTLIIGESGTGKEIAARQIHLAGKRKEKPFIAVDCGALPEELAGSELFGFMKGAFTGAIQDKAGYFEQAKGGTLFLDEIGNLSYENQVKLLRVLEEKKVRRIGGIKDISINVRILAATNDDLREKVDAGEFREDLFFRINEFNIELPALRDRGSDLDQFLNHFLKKANKDLDKEIKGFNDEVFEKFKNYPWPGNIRELKNVVKRATLIEQGKKISIESIPEEIIYPVLNDTHAKIDIDKELITLKDISEAAEKKAILNALKKTHFNKSKCAKLLMIDRKTLYNKMNAYAIEI